MRNYTLGEIKRKRSRGERLPSTVEAVLERARWQLTEALHALDRSLRHAIDKEFGEGTAAALGDPWSVFDKESREVLAPRLRWRTYTRQGAELMRNEAETYRLSRANVRTQHSLNGLFMAGQEMDRERWIRLGKRWVTGDDGRKIERKPNDLLPAEAVQCFCQAAREASLASLQGTAWPPDKDDTLDRGIEPEAAIHFRLVTYPEEWTQFGNLAEEIRREEEEQARLTTSRRELEAVRRRAGPKYRAHLDALVAYMHQHDADHAEAVKEVTRAAGVTPGNIHVQHHKQRKQGRPPMD